MNMMNAFLNTSELWNKDKMENGPLQFWVTIVLLDTPEMFPNSCTREWKPVKKSKR